MRRCRGSYHKQGKKQDFELGYFHQFGTSYEEFESGPGNFMVAIVELPDGSVVQPDASDIHFIDDRPTE